MYLRSCQVAVTSFVLFFFSFILVAYSSFPLPSLYMIAAHWFCLFERRLVVHS